MADEKCLNDRMKFAKGGIFTGKHEIPVEPEEMIIPEKQAISIFGLDDIVKVVRCKDCKYYEMNYGRGNMGCSNQKAIWTQCPPDAFCSYGERKDNA